MLTIDNINGTGTPSSTSFGLFFGAFRLYTGPNINVEVFGGPDANSLAPIVTLSGANALFYSGVPGIFLDPTFSTYNVPGVASGAPAVLQIRPWVGNAPSYTNASLANQFWGPGTGPANTFTFINPTGGGGTPPGPPKSLDGMPGMHLFIPEPSTTALTILGAVAMVIFRRRNSHQ
jgi:hypothetical protein